MPSPSVSVVMAVYNGASYLQEALSSVLAQTFTDYEFIIVDDGSADSTPAILSRISDPRIVVLRNDTNRGLVYSLNRGLEVARGTWVARMDADDVSRPDRFERQMDYLRGHQDVDVLGTGMAQISVTGDFLNNLTVPTTHERVSWCLLFDCPLFHATTMMRRDVLREAGGYREQFAHAEDVDLWRRMWGRARFANLNEMLYVRRWHEQSVCNREGDTQASLMQQIRKEMWEVLLQHEVSDQVVALLSSNEYPVLTHPQINHVIATLLELYDRFVEKRCLSAEDRQFIHQDLVYRMVGLAQRNGYVHPSVLKHPWKLMFSGPVKAMLKRIGC